MSGLESRRKTASPQGKDIEAIEIPRAIVVIDSAAATLIFGPGRPHLAARATGPSTRDRVPKIGGPERIFAR